MWISPGVCHRFGFVFLSVERSRFLVCVFRVLALSFLPVLIHFLDPGMAAADQLVVKIILNQEDKGDFFVIQGENGDFLIKTEDLTSLGLRSLSGPVSSLDGESYLSLRSVAGVDYSFNEETLSLVVSANPSLLGKEIIDFLPEREQKVSYPRDSSLFLNYGADYQAGDGFSFTSFNLSNQLGIRTGDILFLTDSVYTKDHAEERFIRLQSNFTYDDRNTFRRLTVGDFFASSGNLGGNLNLGGISISKIYRMDPYYVYYPTLNLAGQVALPSDAKIYLNGMLIKTEKLSPGEFELKNLTPFGSAGTIDVVLRDSFGREQLLNYPFYFADSLLLKKGFHEYSYNLGFTREEYGSRSNRYSKLAFSAFHRYGFSDNLTMGFHAEAENNLCNIGPHMTFLAGRAGIVSLSLASSSGKGSNSGAAGIATYTYQGLNIGARLSLAGYSRNYAIVTDTQSDEKTKFTGGCELSYNDPLLGTLSLDLTSVRKYVGDDRDAGTVSYNRNLSPRTSITATYRRVREGGYSNEFFITFNFTPKPDLFVSTSYEQTEAGKTAAASLQKNPPVGEGFSYRASVKRSDVFNQTTWTVNPELQYNGRYGVYEGAFQGNSSEGERSAQYHFSVAGALVYVGKTFGATRPVYDSFGLVNVGMLEGVKVLLNSQVVGETDSSGKLFVPNLGSYNQNQVGIQDKDIPIDYYLSSVKRLVSPPLRSGSCISFVAKKLQPISGRLAIRIGAELQPVEFQEVALKVNGRDITFPTGSGGEFDIDLSQSDEFKKVLEIEESGCSSISGNTSVMLKPGSYQAAVQYEGTLRSFSLSIPDTTEPLIDLGQVVISDNP
ncbi:MAG: fimbrial biogenesis outer membrane usher protein [Deltaproteobacteria bacterium]|nr:fimbrial biogenesis outer membrane usher protein [Deltaproteobacteria bacterium]TLN03223.1 MAG: fimbrial biogenesis outer membrane usher protein [bacterium]